MSDVTDELTVLLNKSSGDAEIKSRVIDLIYQDLKKVAGSRLNRDAIDSTITVTALVHEAFIRLNSSDEMTWESRRHFFGAASEAMRRILIDRFRYHNQLRRKGEKNAISLDEGIKLNVERSAEMVALDDALKDLESADQELARVVKLKYFAGLSLNAIADLNQVSLRTINRRWTAARAYLLMHIEQK